jgi:glucosamine-6-phosphate deaminase
MWTLSSLQLHPHPLIVVDEDATLELQVKTVKVSTKTCRSFVHARLTNVQYFKSIEMVASELGFRQMLPRKRDSLVEDQIIQPEANKLSLAVPQQDISRSASPLLEAMSARITQDVSVEPMDELQLSPMSARVAS